MIPERTISAPTRSTCAITASWTRSAVGRRTHHTSEFGVRVSRVSYSMAELEDEQNRTAVLARNFVAFKVKLLLPSRVRPGGRDADARGKD